jgi:hypothetical protein
MGQRKGQHHFLSESKEGNPENKSNDVGVASAVFVVNDPSTHGFQAYASFLSFHAHETSYRERQTTVWFYRSPTGSQACASI